MMSDETFEFMKLDDLKLSAHQKITAQLILAFEIYEKENGEKLTLKKYLSDCKGDSFD